MITTTEHIRFCPFCNGKDLVKDYKRDELYCHNCGVVLTNPYPYVGLEKVESIVPHSAPHNVRSGIHFNYVHKDQLGRFDNRNTTSYRHNLPNWQLMKRGRSKKQYG